MLGHNLRIAVVGTVLLGSGTTQADHLFLSSGEAQSSKVVQTTVMRPFELYLVAQRDSAKTQLSAAVFTLVVPDGLLVVGEELLVDSLLGIGSSREGINLVFRCVEGPQVRVLRYRLVATRPLEATLRLRPDARTGDLGVVTCKDENFALIHCPSESLQVRVH